jgi:hypothetical protein
MTAFGPFIKASLLCLSGCSLGTQPSGLASIYKCAEGRHIRVGRDASKAQVAYDNALYSLSRRPSSIGQKYTSAEATLIIDGDYAAFVSETIVDLDGCYEVP